MDPTAHTPREITSSTNCACDLSARLARSLHAHCKQLDAPSPREEREPRFGEFTRECGVPRGLVGSGSSGNAAAEDGGGVAALSAA